jgi:fucose permease
MYACFGVGAMFSPLIIGAFVDHGIAWNVSLSRSPASPY